MRSLDLICLDLSNFLRLKYYLMGSGGFIRLLILMNLLDFSCSLEKFHAKPCKAPIIYVKEVLHTILGCCTFHRSRRTSHEKYGFAQSE